MPCWPRWRTLWWRWGRSGGEGRGATGGATLAAWAGVGATERRTDPLRPSILPASTPSHTLRPPARPASLLILLSCCLARELTKRHEEFWRGSLQDALAEFAERGPRGEFVLLVEGASEEAAAAGSASGPVGEEQILEALRQAVAAGESPSSAAKSVAARLGQSRKLCYQLSLALSEDTAS